MLPTAHTADNARATQAAQAEAHWVFGYGSLIWRPDFAYRQRCPARLPGWSRRFWQGSHDHRGVADAPGRVVTLIADVVSQCLGVAYALAPDVYERVVQALDVREQNGYARFNAEVELAEVEQAEVEQADVQPCATAEPYLRTPRRVRALIYIATPDNSAFVGPASVPQLAHTIRHAHGPSGSNREYLFELAAALRRLQALTGHDTGQHDAHVFELEAAVRALDAI